jgi:hypothetical protein
MAKLTRATIHAGNTTLVLPINPQTATWGYQENTVSKDTIGGRVVQLLSVQVTDLMVQAVAGSRPELQRIAEGVRQVMEYHTRTLRPATFRVPSRAWDFRVYLGAMPQIGWDVATTTYPYSLQMVVDEDVSGVQRAKLETAALTRLYEGIGYSPEFHGGDAKAFEKTVKTVLAAQANLGGSSAGGNSGDADRGDTGGGGGAAGNEGTSAIQEVQTALYKQFPRADTAGVFCCRPVGGSNCNYKGFANGWSQHAWGNGWDIVAWGGLHPEGSVPNGEYQYMESIARWLVQNAGSKGQKLPIAQVIWEKREQLTGSTNVDDHYNHVHVSGDPMFEGQPPCASR